MPNIEIVLITTVAHKQHTLLEKLYQEISLEYLRLLGEPIPHEAVLKAANYLIQNSAFTDGFYFDGDVSKAVKHTIISALKDLK